MLRRTRQYYLSNFDRISLTGSSLYQISKHPLCQAIEVLEVLQNRASLPDKNRPLQHAKHIAQQAPLTGA